MKILGLACLAAWNPKLLAVDVILMGNRRPRPMFACFLLGGIGLALTIGLLDVFVLHADAIKSQGSASAGLDLTLGVPLLTIGLLLATGHPHGRRRHQAAAGERPPKRDGWAQRILHEPRYGLAVLIGALAGTPGALYIAALHSLVNGTLPTAAQALAVVGFVVIEFALVIIPFALLAAAPERTMTATQH
ncbi:MAG TPA: GAP family protein, partial [Streptosporangiaceae bacterium]|nr:GAP family protein [Streptosporangiaceae bacterium]